MTAEEVIRFADEMRLLNLNSRLERQRIALNDAQDMFREQQAELEAYQLRLSAAEEILNDIVISNAEYFWQRQRYSEEPVIAFRIENNSEIAIGRIFLHGVVQTPGRSIPWIDENVSYVIRGGLEPGESDDLRLAPNRFGEWGLRELADSDDHILELTLFDIEGPDGERLVGPMNNYLFGDETEEERMEARIASQQERIARIESVIAEIESEIFVVEARLAD